MTIGCYIAAPWGEQAQAREVRAALLAAGFRVTARWLDAEDTHDPAMLIQHAKGDIEDIWHSHVFILINSQARGAETSGKAVETGIALTLGMPILAIGEKTNVFHHLVHPTFFTWFQTVEELIAQLTVWAAEQSEEMDRIKEESKVSGIIVPGGVN